MKWPVFSQYLFFMTRQCPIIPEEVVRYYRESFSFCLVLQKNSFGRVLIHNLDLLS